jgi:hypothetical protein
MVDAMGAWEQALNAHRTLLNDSGVLSYFHRRGITEAIISAAHVGYRAGAFTYPCIAREGCLLGIHYKSKGRDEKGKRRQWWGGYAEDLPPKGHGKKPDDPAKIIPFGMETLEGLEPGSLVVLCCGEEDALSLRQVGYTALSQPGAGLLEPVYAREFAGFEVVVFYDAGEEAEARRDALKLATAGAESVRVVEWSQEASHGADINGRLGEDRRGFKVWAAGMIANAKPLTSVGVNGAHRDGEPDSYTAPIPEPPSLLTLDGEALYGLPGEIVRAIEPHTEADRVAVLANLLCAFGNAIGRGIRLRVGADTHHLKINVGLVGETAKGRKGMSWGHVRELMHAADSGWVQERVLNGLSSGEGLIYAVRDEVRGRNKQDEEITVDEGVRDKRLLVLESELASTLKVMSREGNTLSPVVRQAWDEGRLQVLTRNNPLKATDTHVSVIGHITKAELLRYLTETEAANGFANRIIWLLVRRSKELPFGGEWHRVDTTPLVKRLTSALQFGKMSAEVGWGEDAKEAWREVYGPLSRGKPGLFGAVVGRAEAQVVRLAAIYAVMDESHSIQREHLEAALALWDYAEASARYMFGDATGDPVADQILEALRAAGREGMSRTEIRTSSSATGARRESTKPSRCCSGPDASVGTTRTPEAGRSRGGP